MNAQTRLTADGHVAIPQDVRDALDLKPGTPLRIVKGVREIRLKLPDEPNPFPPTTIEEILAFPKWRGRPRTIEEISEIDGEALRHILDERDRAGSGY